MAKKIKPEDQTKELNKARLNFLKRNPSKYDEFLQTEREGESLCDSFEKNNLNQEDKDDVLSEVISRPAVLHFWGAEATASASVRACHRAGIGIDPLPNHENDDEWRRKYEAWQKLYYESKDISNYFLEELVKESSSIIKYLMEDRAAQCYLVSIDLARPLETILAEVKALVIHEKKFMPVSRLKWLSKWDELLQVWDLHAQAGKQPWQKTFEVISKKVARPISTVKGQWYLAYEKIYGKPYDPELKHATEEKRREADALCAACPHLKPKPGCYRNGNWLPCATYLKISGKEKNLKLLEYRDGLNYTLKNP